jgi:GST-like protein
MMSYPWTLAAPWLEIPLDEFADVVRWHATMAARPGVQRGMALMKEQQTPPPEKMDEKTREILYGKKQFEKR